MWQSAKLFPTLLASVLFFFPMHSAQVQHQRALHTKFTITLRASKLSLPIVDCGYMNLQHIWSIEFLLALGTFKFLLLRMHCFHVCGEVTLLAELLGTEGAGKRLLIVVDCHTVGLQVMLPVKASVAQGAHKLLLITVNTGHVSAKVVDLDKLLATYCTQVFLFILMSSLQVFLQTLFLQELTPTGGTGEVFLKGHAPTVVGFGLSLKKQLHDLWLRRNDSILLCLLQFFRVDLYWFKALLFLLLPFSSCPLLSLPILLPTLQKVLVQFFLTIKPHVTLRTGITLVLTMGCEKMLTEHICTVKLLVAMSAG